MSRRRLRLIASSSDEEEDDQPQQQQPRPQDEEQLEFHLPDPTLNLENVTLTSSYPYPNHHSEPIELETSDDEFVNASEDFYNSPPPLAVPTRSFPSTTDSRSSTRNGDDVTECGISGLLRGLGLRLRREWLDSCIQRLESAIPGFSSFDSVAKAKFCFEQFLYSDMNVSGAGLLPENVQSMHLVDLPGPFVLQVDEIVNISRPLRGRYQNAPSGPKRCLKLSMTDGVQRVFGMEYRPIKDLEVLAPAGIKVAICNVNIRHGLMMLVPEIFEILGGLVEELDAARQRVVTEVNKPPRGKRTRTGVVPPLASRATLAAWPPDNVRVSVPASNHVPQVAIPFWADNQGNASGFSASGRAAEELDVPINRVNVEPTSAFLVNGRGAEEPAFIHGVNAERTSTFLVDGLGAEEPSFLHGVNAARQSTNAAEQAAVPNHWENAEPSPSSSAVSDTEDTPMAEAMEHPSVLIGEREKPFTYLSSLSVKLVAMEESASYIQGKVKCIMTGVKGFQFKGRATFDLCVYVDDGSLISEILIDHHVVQKAIGFSPDEVTAALGSSDSKKVSDMRQTMKQFQIFLANFEGMILIRMGKAFPIPVVIEMSQGCSVSDGWLLLRRLKSCSAQPLRRSQLDPIDISP